MRSAFANPSIGGCAIWTHPDFNIARASHGTDKGVANKLAVGCHIAASLSCKAHHNFTSDKSALGVERRISSRD
jgi:hypothetical protein